MRRLFFVAVILAMLLPVISGPAWGASALWQAWIYETDDPEITVAWDPVDGATGYEVTTIAKYPTQEWTIAAAETSAVLARPRAGLFRFAVRACDDSGCGDWAYSDGPTAAVIVAGEQITAPWGAFWRLSPVIIH